MPPFLSIGDIAREIRELLATQPEFTRTDDAAEDDGCTYIRTFLPSQEFKANITLKEHLPQIAVKEERSQAQAAQFPAGIGQVLRTFTFSVWIYAREYKSAEDAQEFCRAAARNLELVLLRFPLGYPPGIWTTTITGETEYLLVKLTDKFWGVAARVPLTIQLVADADELRGC